LFSIQTRRLTKSFVGVNSSLAQSPGKLRRCKVTVKTWLTRVLQENPPSSKGAKNGM